MSYTDKFGLVTGKRKIQVNYVLDNFRKIGEMIMDLQAVREMRAYVMSDKLKKKK